MTASQFANTYDIYVAEREIFEVPKSELFAASGMTSDGFAQLMAEAFPIRIPGPEIYTDRQCVACGRKSMSVAPCGDWLCVASDCGASGSDAWEWLDEPVPVADPYLAVYGVPYEPRRMGWLARARKWWRR